MESKSNMNTLALLAVIVLAVATIAEAGDVTCPVPVTWTPLVILNLHPDDQVNLDHALIKSLSRCCVSERYPEDRQVSHINRQLTVIAFVLCISVLAVRTVSVLFRLSVSRKVKGVPG
ncbi:hypothetical protein FRC11_010237, partial [Ceratobasidium sp. 423]